jgi:hypothetical protein
MLRRLCVLQFALVLLGLSTGSSAQHLYIGDPAYDYLDYLINSGQTVPRFVLQQPFDLNSLSVLGGKESAIGDYFSAFWHQVYVADAVSVQMLLGDKAVYTGDLGNRYRFSGSAHYGNANFLIGSRFSSNQDYRHDSYYAGDKSTSENRFYDLFYGRFNDAYLEYRNQYLNIFLGRIQRNWGPLNSPSLILSSNPYSYDHFYFSFGEKFFKISLIYTRLEDSNALHYSNPQQVIRNARKFLAGHRLDLMFSRRLQLSLTETCTYGGIDRDFEIAFLNPLQFFYAVQRNNRQEADIFTCLDLFWKPFGKVSIYSQLLVDDFIVSNDPDKDSRTANPDRLGVYLSLRSADLFFKGINFDLAYIRIWNRTYQSLRTWQNYHYRGLGLGYPRASCEELKFKIGFWGLFPFFLENQIILGRYGSVSLTDLFPGEIEEFPVGPVLHNITEEFMVWYFYSTRLRFSFSMKYFRESEHYLNRLYPESNLLLTLGFEYLFFIKL